MGTLTPPPISGQIIQTDNKTTVVLSDTLYQLKLIYIETESKTETETKKQREKEREHSILNSRIDILFKCTSNVLQNRSHAGSPVSTNVERQKL